MSILPAVDQAGQVELFWMYTEPQSHYTGRTIHEKETVQRTDKTVLLRQEHGYKEKDVYDWAEARNVRLFAEEFGHGVRQSQRQTKKRSGTLPFALSTVQRIISPRKDNVVDVIVILELHWALQWTKDNLKAQPEKIFGALFPGMKPFETAFIAASLGAPFI